MVRKSLGRPLASQLAQPSQLALGRHCGRPAPRPGEEGVSHGQEVGAAVTVSPWPTLWAGQSEPRVGGRRSRHSSPLADTVGARPRGPARRE